MPFPRFFSSRKLVHFSGNGNSSCLTKNNVMYRARLWRVVLAAWWATSGTAIPTPGSLPPFSPSPMLFHPLEVGGTVQTRQFHSSGEDSFLCTAIVVLHSESCRPSGLTLDRCGIWLNQGLLPQQEGGWFFEFFDRVSVVKKENLQIFKDFGQTRHSRELFKDRVFQKAHRSKKKNIKLK